MTTARQLTWDNFKATILVAGQQRVHRVTGSPVVEIFGDGSRNVVGLWLEVPAATDVPTEVQRLASVSGQVVERGGRHFLEVSTSQSALHQQFYYFASAVADRIADGTPPTEALSQELQYFAELLAERGLLGIERQIGLLGELLFIERLIQHIGLTAAVDAWVGPDGEPHDFRFSNRDFEVKTTVRSRRVHVIHGAGQLAPVPGRPLYIASILLAPPGAGAGFSLFGQVTQLRAALTADLSRQRQFDRRLEETGYRPADAVHYERRFSYRRPIALVPVTSACPAITRPMIQDLLGPLAARVDSLQYDVDLEGLESEDGTPVFSSWLP